MRLLSTKNNFGTNLDDNLWDTPFHAILKSLNHEKCYNGQKYSQFSCRSFNIIQWILSIIYDTHFSEPVERRSTPLNVRSR